MAIDFPSSPTSGQQYQGYTYNSTIGAWQANAAAVAPSTVSANPPANPTVGDMWFNTNDGSQYFYYNDGNTSQWVESRAPITANGYYSPNYIINGGFDIWQRGTSFSTSAAYTADRWFNWTTSGTVSVSRQAFTSGELPAASFGEANFYMRHSWTAGNGFSIGEQRIEDVRTLSGQTITLSFWARSNVTVTSNPEVEQFFGSGGSASVYLTPTAVNIGTSWQRYAVSYTLPNVSGKTLGANHFLAVRPIRISGTTSHQVDLWGVQIESGGSASAFRRNANSIQGELAACQRYFYNPVNEVTAAFTAFANAVTYSANAARVAIELPVTMRTVPSISGITVGDFWLGYGNIGNNFQATGMQIDPSTRNHLQLTVNTGGGMTNNISCQLYRPSATTGIFPISAEL